MRIVFNCPIPHWYLDWPHHERVCWLIGTYDGDTCVVTRMVPTVNRAANQRDMFAAIGGGIYEEALVGILHTHPHGDVEPSELDRSGIPPGLVGVVWWKKNYRTYKSKKKGAAPEGTTPLTRPTTNRRTWVGTT